MSGGTVEVHLSIGKASTVTRALSWLSALFLGSYLTLLALNPSTPEHLARAWSWTTDTAAAWGGELLMATALLGLAAALGAILSGVLRRVVVAGLLALPLIWVAALDWPGRALDWALRRADRTPENLI